MFDAILFMLVETPKMIWALLVSLNMWVLLPIVGLFVFFRVIKAGPLAWALAWWISLYALLRWGFDTPIPRSVITIYMAITTVSILAYLSQDRDRWQQATEPVLRLMTDPQKKWRLLALVLAIPALAAASVYARMMVPLEAPSFGRTVHPAPPAAIDVGEESVDLVSAESPLLPLKESNPDEYAARVENGRKVYYQNCFYCHGDGMAGDGMFAYGLNPIPSNFTDPGVLPGFQESYFLWRVAHGGPGLPAEGGPWDTAMPAWQDFFSQEDLWDVVRYLYEFNELEPRALGEVAAAGGEER